MDSTAPFQIFVCALKSVVCTDRRYYGFSLGYGETSYLLCLPVYQTVCLQSTLFLCLLDLSCIMLSMWYAVSTMPDETTVVDGPKAIASLGGKARAKALSKEERRSIAAHAAAARWNRELPRATYLGELIINDKRIGCAVLETGKRLLTQQAFWTAIGGPGGFKVIDGVSPFLADDDLKPFISDQLREATTPIFFRDETGARHAGYDASLLPMMCEAYRELRDRFPGDGKPISDTQEHIIATCDSLARALASEGGIVALIDKATGYQASRAKDKLAETLENSVPAELRPWIRRFPDELFWQFCRLQGQEFKLGSSESRADFAKFINKFIFENLPLDVMSKLLKSSPMIEKRYRRQRRLQSLIAYTGDRHLDQQITIVTTLLRIARNQAEFQDLFNRAFAPKEPTLVITDISMPASVSDA
jgi:P63C domain-containing protein